MTESITVAEEMANFHPIVFGVCGLGCHQQSEELLVAPFTKTSVQSLKAMKRQIQVRLPMRLSNVLLTAACFFSAACVGIKTPGERESRERVQKVLNKYRQADAAPNLPALRGGSSPETFVRYAIYKHPQVEAAYDEWVASV